MTAQLSFNVALTQTRDMHCRPSSAFWPTGCQPSFLNTPKHRQTRGIDLDPAIEFCEWCDDETANVQQAPL